MRGARHPAPTLWLCLSAAATAIFLVLAPSSAAALAPIAPTQFVYYEATSPLQIHCGVDWWTNIVVADYPGGGTPYSISAGRASGGCPGPGWSYFNLNPQRTQMVYSHAGRSWFTDFTTDNWTVRSLTGPFGWSCSNVQWRADGQQFACLVSGGMRGVQVYDAASFAPVGSTIWEPTTGFQRGFHMANDYSLLPDGSGFLAAGWSDEGERCEAAPNSYYYPAGVYRYDAVTGAFSPVLPTVCGMAWENVATPRVSPDGSRFAYTVGVGIRVASTDGSGDRALPVTLNPGESFSAIHHWELDGRGVIVGVRVPDAGWVRPWRERVERVDVVTGRRTIVLDRPGSDILSVTPARLGDSAPPVTTDDAPTGPVNASVDVHLEATDGESGIAATYASVDGGAFQATTTVTISAPADHSGDGAHTLSYYSVDGAGNVEATRSVVIVVDTTSPVINYVGNRGTYTVAEVVDISCTATDGLTGVVWTDCTRVGGPAAGFGLGATTLTASASDAAGNTTTASTTFTVIVTPESLGELVAELLGESNAVNSILASINAIANAPTEAAASGGLTALANKLEGLVAKGLLTAAQAELLLQLAASL
jgi:hypothetical protein